MWEMRQEAAAAAAAGIVKPPAEILSKKLKEISDPLVREKFENKKTNLRLIRRAAQDGRKKRVQPREPASFDKFNDSGNYTTILQSLAPLPATNHWKIASNFFNPTGILLLPFFSSYLSHFGEIVPI